MTVARALVVKNAWKRQVSNSVACPSRLRWLRSGMRRTTNRPGTCLLAFLELNAVNAISATSAREFPLPVVSS